MGVKLGVFLGLLAASAIAGVIVKTKTAEAPGLEAAGSGEEEKPPLKEALARVRQRTNEAMEAGHQASDEKEAELRSRYEQLKRGS